MGSQNLWRLATAQFIFHLFESLFSNVPVLCEKHKYQLFCEDRNQRSCVFHVFFLQFIRDLSTISHPCVYSTSIVSIFIRLFIGSASFMSWNDFFIMALTFAKLFLRHNASGLNRQLFSTISQQEIIYCLKRLSDLFCFPDLIIRHHLGNNHMIYLRSGFLREALLNFLLSNKAVMVIYRDWKVFSLFQYNILC